ncbi:hypothetical protein [Amylibacter marinus]|uniref:hypothetical protein n=1 Tax=Amylibacter marinus TaxID=1475483 RepID=UPI0024E151A8|nr:hypothetical protein [Amylibacter marinus]
MVRLRAVAPCAARVGNDLFTAIFTLPELGNSAVKKLDISSIRVLVILSGALEGGESSIRLSETWDFIRRLSLDFASALSVDLPCAKVISAKQLADAPWDRAKKQAVASEKKLTLAHLDIINTNLSQSIGIWRERILWRYV